MRRTSAAFTACLVLGATSALGADLPPQLAKAVHDYDRAQFANDVATLDRLVVDDFVLVNSDASVEAKAQFLADFKLPGFKIEPYVIEQPVHKVWRDGAVIGGLVNLRWSQDGKHQTRKVRVAYVWLKRDGRWRATYAQVTRVP
jgi:ketosteroid isomerase-like protein